MHTRGSVTGSVRQAAPAVDDDPSFWTAAPSRDTTPRAMPAPLSDDLVLWKEDLSCYDSDSENNCFQDQRRLRHVSFSDEAETTDLSPFGPIGWDLRKASSEYQCKGDREPSRPVPKK